MKKSKFLVTALVVIMLTTGCSVGFNIGDDGSDYAKEHNQAKQEATYSIEGNTASEVTTNNTLTDNTVESSEVTTDLKTVASVNDTINFEFEVPSSVIENYTVADVSGTPIAMYKLSGKAYMALNTALLDSSYSIEDHIAVTKENNDAVVSALLTPDSKSESSGYTTDGQYYVYKYNSIGTLITDLQDVIFIGEKASVTFFVIIDTNNFNCAIVEIYSSVDDDNSDIIEKSIKDTIKFTQTYEQNTVNTNTEANTEINDEDIYTVESYDGKYSSEVMLGNNLEVSASTNTMICTNDAEYNSVTIKYGHTDVLDKLLNGDGTYVVDNTAYTLLDSTDKGYYIKCVSHYDTVDTVSYYLDTIGGEINAHIYLSNDLSDTDAKNKINDLTSSILYR